MACLRFLRNFRTSHLLSAAGLVVAAAGTVYLARRFWRTAELEEDQQHLLALEDSDASADLDLTLDEIVNEDNGQVMTWDFSPLFCGPVAAVRYCQSAECPAPTGSTTFHSHYELSLDMLVIKDSLEHCTSVCGNQVDLWVKNTRGTMAVSPDGLSMVTMTLQSVTGFKLVARKVVMYASFCILDANQLTRYSDHVQTVWMGKYFGMILGLDGLLSTYEWKDSKNEDQPTEPCQSDHEAADEELPPVAREMPCLYIYLTRRGFADVPCKLAALRQAFSTLISQGFYQKDLIRAGKMILGGLAQINNRDIHAFEMAFEQFLAFLGDPAKRDIMQRELAEAGICQFGFVDVALEFVVFWFLGVRNVLKMESGGFVDYCSRVLESFSPLGGWKGKDTNYWEIVMVQILSFLDEVFFKDTSIFQDPQYLEEEVWNSTEDHLNILLTWLGSLHSSP
ncbi:uncharacterized protein LOC125709474 isoform X7 [Brienomyrus brachyistius]|uniref:uncharacterized protein LOC125709474 isoform X3 n=1 Tax=Brienomyrus brachyistius TaxID=42636 RepID=UPI0020B44720|nr:uncharacterized protein LOC125709474 isoform X3 [Brienomyrus brachyistius]XP_048833935.1 uncharacterized protein LOC125709474 isoform X7 [Brienomyrus brachyistius]